MQPIRSKIKSQSQIVRCEWALSLQVQIFATCFQYLIQETFTGFKLNENEKLRNFADSQFDEIFNLMEHLPINTRQEMGLVKSSIFNRTILPRPLNKISDVKFLDMDRTTLLEAVRKLTKKQYSLRGFDSGINQFLVFSVTNICRYDLL